MLKPRMKYLILTGVIREDFHLQKPSTNVSRLDFVAVSNLNKTVLEKQYLIQQADSDVKIKDNKVQLQQMVHLGNQVASSNLKKSCYSSRSPLKKTAKIYHAGFSRSKKNSHHEFLQNSFFSNNDTRLLFRDKETDQSALEESNNEQTAQINSSFSQTSELILLVVNYLHIIVGHVKTERPGENFNKSTKRKAEGDKNLAYQVFSSIQSRGPNRQNGEGNVKPLNKSFNEPYNEKQVASPLPLLQPPPTKTGSKENSFKKNNIQSTDDQLTPINEPPPRQLFGNPRSKSTTRPRVQNLPKLN